MVKKTEIVANEKKRKPTKKELKAQIEELDKNLTIAKADYKLLISKHRAMTQEWEKCENEYNEELEKNDSLEKDLFYERQKTEKYLRNIGALQDKLAKIEEELNTHKGIYSALIHQSGTLSDIISKILNEGGKVNA